MLSVEKANEIAMKVLLLKLEKSPEDFSNFTPSELKREVNNVSKKLGITVKETAEFIKLMLEKNHQKILNKLDEIIAS